MLTEPRLPFWSPSLGITSIIDDKLTKIQQSLRPEELNAEGIRTGTCPTTLPYIPEDINLTFYLRNFNELVSQAAEYSEEDATRYHLRAPQNAERQSDIFARVVFFGGLDEFHSFEIYHRSVKAYVFSILTKLHSVCRGDIYRLDEFELTFLMGVRERMNNPTVFHARENFVRLWRRDTEDIPRKTGMPARKFQKRYHDIRQELQAEMEAGAEQPISPETLAVEELEMFPYGRPYEALNAYDRANENARRALAQAAQAEIEEITEGVNEMELAGNARGLQGQQ